MVVFGNPSEIQPIANSHPARPAAAASHARAQRPNLCQHRSPPGAAARHGSEEEGLAAGCGRGGDGGVDGAGGGGRRLRGGPGGVLGHAGGAGDVPDVRAGAGDGDGADARLLRGAQDGAAEQPQVPVRADQGPGRPQPGAQAQRHQGAQPPRRLQRPRKHLRLPQAAEPAARLQGRAGVRAVREAGSGTGQRTQWRRQRGALDRAEERSGGRSRQAVVGSGKQGR